MAPTSNNGKKNSPLTGRNPEQNQAHMKGASADGWQGRDGGGGRTADKREDRRTSLVL